MTTSDMAQGLKETDATPRSAAVALRFTVDEYRTRCNLLWEEVAGRGVDVYMGTVPEHMAHLAGFTPSALIYQQAVFLNADSNAPIVFTHKAESEIARKGCWGDDIRVWRHGEDPIARMVEILRELGAGPGSTVGLEWTGVHSHLSVDTYLRLVDELPDVQFLDVTDVGRELRIIKSPAEIEYMRKAARLADAGMKAALETIRPGIRECDVNAAIQSALWTAGSENAAFPTLAASGPNSGLFHAFPSERVIEPGDPVELEIDGVVARYNSNILRTPIAGRAPAWIADLHKIVTDAYWEGMNSVAPGVPVGEIDRICKQVRKGYEDYFPARSGFEVGLGFEGWVGKVSILEGEPYEFTPGMTFSLEPSIAQMNGITVIAGNVFLVTVNGYEILNDLESAPMNLIELD